MSPGYSHGLRVSRPPFFHAIRLLLSFDVINYTVSEYRIGSCSHVTRISESGGFTGA